MECRNRKLMFEWYRKLRGSNLDNYGFLGTDMHAHWLPGIDDGAKDIGESLAMIRELKALGFHRLIATPHIMADLYRNTPEMIKGKLALVREACNEENIDIELGAAAEYLLDEGFESHIREHGPLVIGGENYLLVEFGFYQPPMDADSVFFRLATAGYRVILAHPERYPYYHGKPEQLQRFHEKGVLFQINLLSLLGGYGNNIQQAAENLLKQEMVDFLGTDAHSVAHINKLRDGLGRGKLGYLVGGTNFANSRIQL